MLVTTCNSTYEIDPVGRRFRRTGEVSGHHQLAPGEWEAFEVMSRPVVGEPLRFFSRKGGDELEHVTTTPVLELRETSLT